MKFIAVLITLILCIISAQAQLSDRSPVSAFKAGQLKATIYSTAQLEDISARKLWLIKGRVYGGPGFDADKAIWQGHIVCSFFIPSGKLKSNDYKLYYTENDRELNTNHLEFNAENNFFGITCFKKQGWPELTLAEMNMAFGTLLKYIPAPQQ